nr:EAL domain-containing protein [Solimicrobium silvestre]
MLLKIIFLSLVYFMAGWLGLQIPYAGTHITLVWLPTGIAVASLLLWGRSVWPGIFLGAVLVNFSIGSTWLLASGIAVGNTLAPLLTVALLRRSEFHAVFDRKKDVGTFILAACLGMLVSASSGVLQLNLGGLLPVHAMGSAWLSWWMGDVIGVLLAAPVLLTLNQHNINRLAQERKELLLWFFIALPIGWLTFIHNFQGIGQTLPLAFLTLPLFAWAALRFGVTGSGLAVLGFSILAAWGTATQHGNFFLPDAHVSLFLLWSYMTSAALTGLLITALQAERIVVEDTLLKNEKQLNELTQSRQAILDGTNFSVISTDPFGVIQIFNQSAERMLGYLSEEMVGKKSPTIFHDHDEMLKRASELTIELGIYVEPNFDAFVAKARILRVPDEHEWTYIRKDGFRFPVLLSVTALVNKLDEVIGYLGVGIDRSEYHQQRNRIRDSDELFRVLYESSSEAHMLTTRDKGFIGANSAAIKLFGCHDLEQFLKLSPATTSPEFQHDGRRSDEKAQEMMSLSLDGGSHTFEWLHQRVDGTIFFAEVLLTRINIGGENILHATVRDITLRKAADEEISKLAFYDALTGLPNRRLLMDRLKQAMANSKRSGREGALMFIDLDHFKNLNDTLGHDIGDVLLQQVAKRLSLCVREIDTVARLGGDEFVVMLNNLSENFNKAAEQVEKIGGKILSTLNQPYLLNGHSHRNTSSIGVTLFSNCKGIISELLKQADLAMYQAKASGRNNFQFFDSKIQDVVNAHVALEIELRHGLSSDEFVLHFQPQVDRENRVIGVEVLIRWQHATRGLILPAEFIPLAENIGLIIPLGLWALETACAQLAVWEKQPERSHLTIAVNVSTIQFCAVNFVEQVIAVIDRTGADPHKLKLEITESILLDNVENIIKKMLTLQSYGISFALDDFGTGYSSLSYLKRLPVSQLKIDRSFVRDVLTDPNDAIFARTIITLGQCLGLVVMAEGVETEEQRQFLFEHDCNAFQGYFFSRPLPLIDFEQFLDQNN